ncbi:transposase [Dapis sp. BLCC M172]|uniref:transposase n=1 Tax=Dapis sp. BLCC M172 TaxID=2975281 RepID=UPI003CF79B0D
MIYDKWEQQYELEENRYASIDIGLNNLATFSCRRQPKPLRAPESNPRVINGRPLKSINQYYNKVRTSLQGLLRENQSSQRLRKLANKREFKINDYLHKTSRLIINSLITQKIGILIIGQNQEWKQEIN